MPLSSSQGMPPGAIAVKTTGSVGGLKTMLTADTESGTSSTRAWSEAQSVTHAKLATSSSGAKELVASSDAAQPAFVDDVLSGSESDRIHPFLN